MARGNMQEQGIHYQEVFAPVARYQTIRVLLAASVSDEMYVHQMDVISAYVQGELHDEIYTYIWSNQRCWCKINKKTKL